MRLLETEFQSDGGSANARALRSKQWQNHSPPIAAFRSATTSPRDIRFPPPSISMRGSVKLACAHGSEFSTSSERRDKI